MPEHINDKAKKQFERDGFAAAKQAIDKVADDLASRGFDRHEVIPFVRKGVEKAATGGNV
jgi:hypothetical protein